MFLRRRLRFSVALIAALALIAPYGVRADDAPIGVPSFAEPAISPDGSEIAFVSGGDIWSVPAGGGNANLLVAAEGYAARPLFSPDGKKLAFTSSRPGAPGIYVTSLNGGSLERLTHDDTAPALSAWSSDSRNVYFTTATRNIAYFGDVMRVSADGGTPMRVVGETYVNSANGAPSPDGSSIAYERNGFEQWWRHGRSHMDQSSLVVYHPGAKRYETITDGAAKDRWPMWSPDGTTIYYVSDRTGHDELYAQAQGRARKLTSIGADPVLFPSISRDGKTIAFEHDFGIWTCDTATGAIHRVSIALRGLPDIPLLQHMTLPGRFSELALSPDAKKLALVARGRVFAASATEGGDAQAAPLVAHAAQAAPQWSRDSRRIAFTIDRGTETALATYDFPDGTVQTITPAGHFDDYAHWSPDGKSIAFVRDGRELRLLDAATHSERVLATAAMDRRPFGSLDDIAFSPAGDWIAFVSDLHAAGFASVSVVPVAPGGQPRTIADLPDGNAGSIVWSPDGSRLYFVTSQRTEQQVVAQIDLVPRAPHFREDTFRQLFDQPRTPGNPVTRPELPSTPAASPGPSASPSPAATPSASPAPKATPAPHTTIDFNGIHDRLALLPSGVNVSAVRITSDGKTLVLVADAAAQQNLYTLNVDETADAPPVARQLTSDAGHKSDLAISADGKTAFFLDGGRPTTVAIAPGSAARPIAVSAALDVDFNGEKDLVFRQAWSLLDRWYADPNFHGADWQAVFRTFEPHVLGARTPVELRRVLSLMLGEMNSSHMGISAPPTGVPRFVTGNLGVQYDAAAYERSGRVRIAQIDPLGPVALAGHIAVGDDILAVNGRTIDPHTNIDDALADTIGKRTVLRIAPGGNTGAAHDTTVLPISLTDADSLRYEGWVESRRAYVDKISGGRLGYVHLLDMGEESLRKFYRDLDVRNRSKDGVIIDVRNNEGGFVDPYALDVLTRRNYVTFKSRFGTDPSERSALGQRAYDKPTVLVTNEHSLSDAENFTEGYRVLHAGTVVGTPTAGWIIFTSAAPLADGSGVRLPSTRVIGPDGVDLELHPRPVDVYADIPPGAADRGDDPQLDAAVRELLRRAH